jgi:Tol biopolymer transport system component
MIKISISEISQNLVSFIRYCILIKFILFEFKMAQCQEKRILKVDDIFNSFNVAQAKFSPDDKWAVVVIERPRKDQLVYGINFINRFDIWLLNVQSNSFVKILDGKRDTCSYWNPVWSEDSNHFAFISTKGQDNIRPYLYNINNGKVIQIHANGINVTTRFYQNNESDNEPFAWLDNDNIVFTASPQRYLNVT